MNIFLSHRMARLVRQAILMSTIALFYYSNNALAQPTEIQELRLEIEALKKRVQELELTNPTKSPTASKVSVVPKMQTKKMAVNSWHSLQVNISKADVTSLLGKPGKIDKWKTGEAWYFPNSKGGEVDFDANNNVSGWLEP